MQIKFRQQDIINTICIATAYDLGVTPNRVDAEIGFDQFDGFWATGQVGFKRLTFNESSIRDSIAMFLREYHHFIPEHLHFNMIYFHETNEFEVDIEVIPE